jgi:non-ribosomal peptide synthetase component F
MNKLLPNSLTNPTPWTTEDLSLGVFQRMEQMAEQFADNCAIYDNDESITYRQLLLDAERLATQLYEALLLRSPASIKTNRPDELAPIGLLFPPGANMVKAMLAVIRLGRPYVPLDLAYPRERILAIAHHAGCALIFTNQQDNLIEDIKVVCPVWVWPSTTDIEVQVNTLPAMPNAQCNAYILYTSGSTGKPKGVYQDQRGLLHDVMQYSQAIGISHKDCFTGFYSPSVNGAIRDIWAALLNGASLVPAQPQVLGFVGMEDIVARYGITVFHAIPPLLRAFLASKPDSRKLLSVRLCYIAGDKFYAREVADLYRVFPSHCQIYTGIGSTECATLYRHWLLDATTSLSTELLPAGYAIEERATYLVAEPMVNPCASKIDMGATGFVQVGSKFLALGYWREPALTQQTFCKGTSNDEVRWFMPGDRFRELSNGLYEYLGRADSQIKVRGFRVDIAELERFSQAWLAEKTGVTHPDVCKVVVWQPIVQEEPLLVWVFATDVLGLLGSETQQQKLAQQLQAALAIQFSHAAQPQAMLWHDMIPRLLNYKLDAQTLKGWVGQQLLQIFPRKQPKGAQTTLMQQALDRLQVTKENATWAQKLIATWCDYFKVHPTSEMAGHSWEQVNADSLSIMNFFSELDNRLGIRTAYQDIALPFSLGKLYHFIAENYNLSATSELTTADLVVVPPFVGLAGLPEFDHLLSANICLTKVPTTALYNPIGVMQPDLSEVVDKLVTYLMHLSHARPIYFYGVSSGAKPAFFAACRLRALGMDVRSIFIGDAGPLGRAQHFGSERLRAFSWLTTDIPLFAGKMIEIIAMKEQPDPTNGRPKAEWKHYSPLGWYKYTRKIAYLPVPADHVVCLTSLRVMDAINAEATETTVTQVPYLPTDVSTASAIKTHAHKLLLTQNALQHAEAVCWYEQFFLLSPALRHIYQFNAELARKRASRFK